MQSDSLKAFVKLRRNLETEQAKLTARLAELNAALGALGQETTNGIAAATGRPSRRVSNELSLKEAILKVIQGKALTKDEVHTAILALGYQFNTDNPLNSIGTVLYGKKPKFKNIDGKFSLA